MLRLRVDDTALELPDEALPAEGLPLLSLAEQGLLPIESSCRAASCGTCLVEVLEGAEHLSPVERLERNLLEVLVPRDGPLARLACQARLLARGPGRCVLRTLE